MSELPINPEKVLSLLNHGESVNENFYTPTGRVNMSEKLKRTI